MSEEKLKGTLYDDKEAVKRFRDFENRYYQQVTVTEVTGQCPYGHTEGEQYRISNCNNDGLCGALYTSLHHSIITLHYWGSLPWSKNPDTYFGVCPEMKVKVEIRRREQEKKTLLKTKSQPRNMVGKGFPAIDKYRAFVEIMGVDKVCTWGHGAGQKLEIDPFNVGGVCGFLYSKVYPYLNILLAGVTLPWMSEDDPAMYQICPDSYNQTSYRLFLEER
jgi:uncharacterized repeat protein (TIGR04076 family)